MEHGQRIAPFPAAAATNHTLLQDERGFQTDSVMATEAPHRGRYRAVTRGFEDLFHWVYLASRPVQGGRQEATVQERRKSLRRSRLNVSSAIRIERTGRPVSPLTRRGYRADRPDLSRRAREAVSLRELGRSRRDRGASESLQCVGRTYARQQAGPLPRLRAPRFASSRSVPVVRPSPPESRIPRRPLPPDDEPGDRPGGLGTRAPARPAPRRRSDRSRPLLPLTSQHPERP
jgi:hypothetical protein